MKLTKFFTAAVAALLMVSCSTGNEWKAGHVIFIGMDGWGAYSVGKSDIPTIKGMMEEGSYTLHKHSVLPSSSAANWATMFMGAGTELHGYTRWNTLALLRHAAPEAEIGHMYEWDGMHYVVDTCALSVDLHSVGPNGVTLKDHACQYIKEKKPQLAVFAFSNPDDIGHQIGHATPEYYAKCHEMDGYVAEIVQAVKDAGIYDDTIFVLTSDHGGINKGHGGKTLMEMESPFIICGKGIRKGHEIQASMMQYDIAATLAEIFGLERPQVWTGRPMMEVFE